MSILLEPKCLSGLVDAKLIAVLDDLIEYTGPVMVTSLYRDGPGVHGTHPVRGIDIRCRHPIAARAYESLVNIEWEYDTKRPEKKVALAHDVGRGYHLHLQVHPNTRKRKQ